MNGLFGDCLEVNSHRKFPAAEAELLIEWGDVFFAVQNDFITSRLLADVEQMPN